MNWKKIAYYMKTVLWPNKVSRSFSINYNLTLFFDFSMYKIKRLYEISKSICYSFCQFSLVNLLKETKVDSS